MLHSMGCKCALSCPAWSSRRQLAHCDQIVFIQPPSSFMTQMVTCSHLLFLLPGLKHVSDRERGNLRFPGHSTHEEGSKVAMGGGSWVGDVPMSPADESYTAGNN